MSTDRCPPRDMPEHDEVRLTVCCPDEAVRAGIVTRVRGAVVEARSDPSRPAPPVGSRDVVMLVGVPPTAESLLAARTNVLLVAKPVPDRGALDKLFATARSVGVQFVAANPERYLPSRQLVRRQIPDALGEPGLIRLHHLSCRLSGRAKHDKGKPKHDETSWQAVGNPPPDPSKLPDPLLRDLDVALWLAGRRPDRVYAVAQEPGRSVQVHLGFPGGGMALLDFDDRLPPGDGYQSLSVIAASGATYADDHQNVQLAFRGGHPQAIRTDERAGQLAAIAQEFVDAIRAGRDVMTENEASWRGVFAVADAVRESLTTGRAVGMEGR